MMSHSRLIHVFFAVLGFVFLSLVLASFYLRAIDSVSSLVSLSSPQLGVWFGLGAISLLTVGVVGIGRQHFRNRRKLFTVIAVFLIPPLIFAGFLVVSLLIVVSAPMFPLRSEITLVSVVSNSPLILSVDVKAITSRTSSIEGASIFDGDGLVAYRPLKPFFELPTGSTKTLILNFNDTFPSGNYIVRLSSWHNNHGSLPFAIP